jgi:hypothetical protein
MLFRPSAAALFTLVALAAQPTPAQLRVYPPDPQPGEDVVLVLAPPAAALLPGQAVKSYRVQSTESGRILIRFDTTYVARPPYPVSVGAAPIVVAAPRSGPYEVFFQHEQGPDIVRIDAIELQAPAAAAPAAPARHGITGNWFDPAQAGWGVNILESDSGPQLFAVWLDYADFDFPSGFPQSPPPANYATRASTWRVMSGGRWITPTMFRGILYQTFDGTRPDGESRNATVLPVGYATFSFLDSGEMDFKAVMRSGRGFAEVSRERRLRLQGLGP